MNIEFLYFLVVVMLALWLAQFLFVRRMSSKFIGQSATALIELFPEMQQQQSSLVYFHAPGCSPCKAMMPDIDSLQDETGQVFKVDIRQHPDIATNIGIRVTPTTILIRDQLVAQMSLGSKKKAALKALLVSQ